jgi:hypothetical protein
LSSFLSELYYGVFLAFIVHLVGFAVATRIGYNYDFVAILGLLTGDVNDIMDHVADTLRESYEEILIYQVAVLGGSIVLGLAAHSTVRRWHLDLRFPALRFNNPWHYSLRGEALLIDILWELRKLKQPYPGRKRIEKFLDSVDVYASVVVSFSQNDYLYYGFVDNFYFKGDGTLKRVVLRSVRRRVLSDDDQERLESDEHDISEDSRFYRIVGDHFSIDAKDIKTFNVEYIYSYEEETAGDGEAVDA